MANHKSALKRHRQDLVHEGRNRAARTRARNAVKAVRAAVAANDKTAAAEALRKASSRLPARWQGSLVQLMLAQQSKK